MIPDYLSIFYHMKVHTLLKKIKLDTISRDVLIGVAIVALVSINIVLAPVTARVDISKGKAYSLSPATVKVVQGLTKPATITFFVSDSMPTSFLTVKSQVADLLREYRASGNKVTIKTIDPKKDEAAATLANEFGIQPVEFSQLQNDQFAVSTGYFGIGVTVQDTKAAIPKIDVTNLEYNITSLLYKLGQTEEQQVAVVGGTSGFSLTGGGMDETIDTLRQILSQQFSVSSTPLDSLSEKVKALVLLDSQVADEAANETSIAGLQSYLQQGGKAIFMTSGVSISPDLQIASASSILKPILAAYGITVKDDLVLSMQSEIVNFGNDPSQRVLTKYPYWLSTNVFNTEASYASNVGFLTFPWVSSLSLQSVPNVLQKQMVRATKQSWTRSGMTEVLPQSIAQPQTSEFSEKLLIAYAKNTQNNSEIVVIPSTRFIQDAFLGRNGNLEFVVNLVNEFASDGLLSGIRSRAGQMVQIPTLSSSQKDMFKWGNVFLLPALFAAYGFMRLSKRG